MKKNSTLSSLKNHFEEKLGVLKEKNSVLSDSIESLKSKNTISIDDDNSINSLIDESYKSFSELTDVVEKLYKYIGDESVLKLYDCYLTERSVLNQLKDSANNILSRKWREKVSDQFNITQDLLDSVQMNNKESMTQKEEMLTLKNEIDKLYSGLSNSKKSIEDSTNKFITIVALLVSLVAIIFGNIIQFTKTELTWQSVVIVNSSILLSTCVIYTIVENIHLLLLKQFYDRDVIKGHTQLCFNIVMLIIISLLAASLVLSIVLAPLL